jgi:ElaB/YqjD/DUF883 family membrane-anchored ribosome-binding protein
MGAMDDAALKPLEPSTGSTARRLFDKVRPNGRAAAAVTRATRDAVTTAGRQARSAADYSARRIRTFPVTSAAVALGAGLLIGALLSPRKWFGGRAQGAPKAGRNAVQKSL